MTPYDELQVLHKQVSLVHKEIANLYQRMSKFNTEYHWSSIEKLIEQEKTKAKELRIKIQDASNRFVNWKTSPPDKQ